MLSRIFGGPHAALRTSAIERSGPWANQRSRVPSTLRPRLGARSSSAERERARGSMPGTASTVSGAGGRGTSRPLDDAPGVTSKFSLWAIPLAPHPPDSPLGGGGALAPAAVPGLRLRTALASYPSEPRGSLGAARVRSSRNLRRAANISRANDGDGHDGGLEGPGLLASPTPTPRYGIFLIA